MIKLISTTLALTLASSAAFAQTAAKSDSIPKNFLGAWCLDRSAESYHTHDPDLPVIYKRGKCKATEDAMELRATEMRSGVDVNCKLTHSERVYALHLDREMAEGQTSRITGVTSAYRADYLCRHVEVLAGSPWNLALRFSIEHGRLEVLILDGSAEEDEPPTALVGHRARPVYI